MCLRRHFAIRVCRVAVKWNVGKPLLGLNGFLHITKRTNMENKMNILILDYEMGLRISEKLHKASVLHVP